MSEEQALGLLQAVIEREGLKVGIEGIRWRPDYQDYQLLLEGGRHCEIRARLIEALFAGQTGDVLREITFRLLHATPFEEWEQVGSAGGEEDGGIVVEDEDVGL